jgi:hypothetical protein
MQRRKSIIQWHKNTGKRPDCEKVLIKYNCGDLIVGSSTKGHNWKIGDGAFNIKEYAIIELEGKNENLRRADFYNAGSSKRKRD